MNIASIDFSLPRQSLDIYVSGCKGPHCEGCHNPSAWDFFTGRILDDTVRQEISDYINNFRIMVKNIMIFGGEPLDQDRREFINFLIFLKSFEIPIWLFTGYLLKDVPPEVIDLIDYVKVGRYQENNLCEDNIQHGIKLASANQAIFKLEES